MTILKRILLGFGLVILIALTQSAFALWAIDRLGSQAEVAASQPITQIDAARAAWDAFKKADEHLTDVTEGIRFHETSESVARFGVLIKEAQVQLDRLISTSISSDTGAKARVVQTNVDQWKKNALVLLGESSATSIPAPHFVAASAKQIGAGLDELVKIALDDAIASRTRMQIEASSSKTLTWILSAVGLVAGLVVAIVAAQSITRPIVRLEQRMQSLSEGDLLTAIEGAGRNDEIGAMARAVVVFRENATARAALEEAATAERQKELQRQSILEQLIHRFRGTAGEVVASVQSEAGNMSGTARNLTDVATRAEQTAGSARTAASESSEHIHTVSAAAEQLTASISEISRQVRGASERVGSATEFARKTDRRVASLADLTDKIGAIVEMIRTIAQQTNLLALNATIEAARAGDAGKGFTVVAFEVKALAAQTAKATDEIAMQIGAIQSATRGAVEDIRSVTEAVSEIGALTEAVANSVEQQSMATEEIARAISRASGSSATATRNVENVASVIGETNSEAGRVTTATGLLTVSARTLTEAVDAFLRDLTLDATGGGHSLQPAKGSRLG